MRRLLFSLLATSFMGTLVGCNTTHGVCDCGCDFDNHCAYREPWVGDAAPRSQTSEPLPEIREALPSAPKKL